MPFATHLIKVRGNFSPEWTEDRLREYVNRKIKEEIDDYFSTQIELFEINNNVIDVWVFISALIETNRIKEMVDKWLREHVKEEGLTVENYEVIEILTPEHLIDGTKPIILIHL
jgi:hypothetical protein